jgi:hypothetical protein
MTSLLSRAPEPDVSEAWTPVPERTLSTRLLVTLTALAGAGLTVYGVSTAWLSTFAGMISQSGWGTRNGNLLVALAAAGAMLAVASAVRPSVLLRWATAASGFAIAGFSGYLLIQLYAVTAQLDGMALAAKGPGLYLSAGGGVLLFATIFLPLPQPPTGQELDSRAEDSAVTSGSGLFRALHSRLRVPAAALAVVAGLSHVPVTPAHLQEAPYIGVLFILFTVTAVLAAALLLVSDTAVAWLVLGGSCALAVAAYVVSRSVGLPLMADDVGNWLDPLGVVAVFTESAVVVVSALVLTNQNWRGSARRR